MLTVEQMRGFLNKYNVNGYAIQAYKWAEDVSDKQKKYIVIQSTGRSIDTDFCIDDVKLTFIAPIGYNRLQFNKDVEQVEKILLNNHCYENIWFFDLMGTARYLESSEGRPIFELNIKVNKAL